MNTFALDIFDDQGSICSFYTVCWKDAGVSETDKFFNKYNSNAQLKQALQELAVFVFKKIANETGALEDYFRFENTAQALPPSGRYKIGELTIDYGRFPLRLYCLRISDQLVVLFNGGEKTAGTAQDGKTSMAFREANAFAKRLLDALVIKDIYITKNGREFRYYNGDTEILL